VFSFIIQHFYALEKIEMTYYIIILYEPTKQNKNQAFENVS